MKQRILVDISKNGKTNLDLLVATVDKTNFKVEVVITTEVSSMSL